MIAWGAIVNRYSPDGPGRIKRLSKKRVLPDPESTGCLYYDTLSQI